MLEREASASAEAAWARGAVAAAGGRGLNVCAVVPQASVWAAGGALPPWLAVPAEAAKASSRVEGGGGRARGAVAQVGAEWAEPRRGPARQ